MRFLDKYSNFYIINESLQPVKDFFSKIGIDYSAVIKNSNIEDDDYVETYEQALSYFYQKLKQINKLGYFYLFARMFNDLRIVYESLKDPSRNKMRRKIDSLSDNIPDIIKFKLSKIFFLFLEISDKNQLNNLRDENFNKIDINTLAKKQQDGSGWSNKLLESLKRAQEFLQIKKWVNTWTNKSAREMIIKDNYYNLDILCSNSIVAKNNDASLNFKRHIFFLKGKIEQYEDPKNLLFLKRFLEKLPSSEDFNSLFQLLKIVDGEFWDMSYWIDKIKKSKGARFVYNKDNMLVVRVEDVETVNEIAYFTTWCIKKEQTFRMYNTPPFTQYILYNFNDEFTNPNCCIGFTVNETNGRLKIDDTFKNNVCQDRLDKPTYLPDIFYQDPTKKSEHETTINMNLINKEITI